MGPGDVVGGRFEIERLAGSGGQGEVFRAKDRLHGSAVALKTMRFPSSESDLAARFIREAEVLSEIRHRSIVRYVAHGVDPVLFLAMEWLEGEDLGKHLNREQLTLTESVALASHVAEALAAAHAHGVVHRDVKPTNIFLVRGSVESVKMLDFGIARLVQAGQRTATGVVLGTFGYMAPEQAGAGRTVDTRADVFSLGCVLFRCLTGRAAFSGDGAAAILAEVLFEETPRASGFRGGIPEALDDLVTRMMAKAPDDRPSSDVVAKALRNLGPLAGDRPAPEQAKLTPSLTEEEQRLVCFVLLRDGALANEIADANPTKVNPTGLDERGADAPMPEPPAVVTPQSSLQAVVSMFDGRTERLADGTTLILMSGSGAATDLAKRAARCSLMIQGIRPSARIAAALGRGDLSTGLPVGSVIDRAGQLLGLDPEARPAPREKSHVRIDEVMAGLLGGSFVIVRSSGAPGFELVRETDDGDARRQLLGKPTVCVGREREVAMLRSIVDACVADATSSVVMVTAPAGTGKSRLRHELMTALENREEPIEVWTAYGNAISSSSSFGMLGQVLRGAAGLVGGEPEAVRRERLTTRVARHVAPEAVARVSEFLGEICGVQFPDAESRQLRTARADAAQMGDEIRRAWDDFIAAECNAGPVLIVLDDLHWGDAPTTRFIDLALRKRDRPLIVLAFARPEVHDTFPRLWAERSLQEIRLPELSPRASARLVMQVLGKETPEDVVARLVEQAGGNAFYLEELIRAVADGKGDVLPETVLAMAQARLERLGCRTSSGCAFSTRP